MIADWEINGVFLTNFRGGRYPDLFAQVHSTLTSHGVEVRLLHAVGEFLARQYSPIQVGPQKFVKFGCDPLYLTLFPELRTGDEVVTAYQSLGDCLHSPIVLDGCNLVASRTKAILTDRIYEENPEWTHADLRKELKRILEVEQIIVVARDPYQIYERADSIVRFIDERTVLVNDYSEVDPAFGNRLARTLRSYDLSIELIPYCPEQCWKGSLLSALGCYTNYLRTEQVVLFPIFGIEQDQIALSRLKSLIPDVPIVPLDCTKLAVECELLNGVVASFRRPRESRT
jgi:agmatine deiminase